MIEFLGIDSPNRAVSVVTTPNPEEGDNTMASIKEHVSFAGIIKGQGREARCTVSALKVTLPGAGGSAYARYSVRDVSERLPEGEYQLSVNGQAFAMRHQGGHWLSPFSVIGGGLRPDRQAYRPQHPGSPSG
jgi:hypothetical protein